MRADVLEISPEVVGPRAYFDAENHGATARSTDARHPRRRTHASPADARALRRHRVRAVEPVDGGHRVALHARVLRGRARPPHSRAACSASGHTPTTSARATCSRSSRRFVSVFPDGTLWLVGDGDVLLVGSNDPLEPRAGGRRRPPGSAPASRRIWPAVGALEPFHVLSMFVGAGRRRWRTGPGGAPVQSDNRAALEFSGPQSVFGRTTADNAMLLRSSLNSRDAARPPSRSSGPRPRQRPPPSATAAGCCSRPTRRARPMRISCGAAGGEPRRHRALEGLIRASAPSQRAAETRRCLAVWPRTRPAQSAKLALSRLLASQGRYDEAVGIRSGFSRGTRQRRGTRAARVGAVGRSAISSGCGRSSHGCAPKRRRARPRTITAPRCSSWRTGTDLALTEARRVLAVNPTHAKAQNLLGACLASQGQRDEARSRVRGLDRRRPARPGTYANLATLELQAGNRRSRREVFRRGADDRSDLRLARRGSPPSSAASAATHLRLSRPICPFESSKVTNLIQNAHPLSRADDYDRVRLYRYAGATAGRLHGCGRNLSRPSCARMARSKSHHAATKSRGTELAWSRFGAQHL